MADEEKTVHGGEQRPPNSIRGILDDWAGLSCLAVPVKVDTEHAFNNLELRLLRYFEQMRNDLLDIKRSEPDPRVPPSWVPLLKAVHEALTKVANGRDDQRLLEALAKCIEKAEHGLLRQPTIRRCWKCQRLLPPRSSIDVCLECHTKITEEDNPHIKSDAKAP